MSRKEQKSFYELDTKLTNVGKPMPKKKIDEMIDDTIIDEIKLIKHLSQMERMADNYTEYVRDKNSNFHNVKQLLNDAQFLTEPFVERKTNQAQHDDLFLKTEHLSYEKLTWEDI